MKNILPPKTKLFISLTAGLCSCALLWAVIDQKEKKIRAQFVTTTVLQAKKYIPEGKRVSPEMIEEVSVPVAYVQPTALQNKSELQDKKGDLLFQTRLGLLKGEQITRSKLIEHTLFRGLAWTLTPDQTAFSLKLAPEQAVAGHLQPGDWVHLYCTLDQQPRWPKDQTTLLLPRVRVLAVQDRVWDPSGSVMSPIKNPSESFESVLVTLALSPREVAITALASDKGRVVLALASPLDSQMPKTNSVDLGDLK